MTNSDSLSASAKTDCPMLCLHTTATSVRDSLEVR